MRRLRRAITGGHARWVQRLPSRLRRALDLDGDAIDPLRVEIGAGQFPTPGFMHVDPDRRARHLEYVARAWDLPFEDDTVHELLAIHVLEHIHPTLVDRTLREWRRVLQPAGFAQIHVPNAATLISTYATGTSSTKWAAMSAIFGTNCNPNATHASQINPQRHYPEHQALYDYALLEEVLLAAGFDRVDDITANTSDRHTAGWSEIIPRLSLIVRATVASAA